MFRTCLFSLYTFYVIDYYYCSHGCEQSVCDAQLQLLQVTGICLWEHTFIVGPRFELTLTN